MKRIVKMNIRVRNRKKCNHPHTRRTSPTHYTHTNMSWYGTRPRGEEAEGESEREERTAGSASRAPLA